MYGEKATRRLCCSFPWVYCAVGSVTETSRPTRNSDWFGPRATPLRAVPAICLPGFVFAR
ncbi:hypothetical protein LSAT2_009981, partial [Lamellibrachia satsuma]